MKFLVLFAVVASAAAELITYENGAVTPVDTPAVAAAKAAHFAAKGAFAYAGAWPYNFGYANAYAGAWPYNYNLGYANAYSYSAYPWNYGYSPLVQHINGAVTPIDTPEVAAAKAEHFAAKGVVAPSYYNAYAYPYTAYAANFAYPGLVAHPNGALVPVEPEDVVKARKEHLEAVAAA